MTLPFMGEMMKCVLCGAEEKSEPTIQSNWRAIEFGGQRFYGCPREFPPDGAPVEAFSDAFFRFGRAALEEASKSGCLPPFLVVSEDDAERLSDFVVCAPVGFPSPFTDNVETDCSKCGQRIFHRPYAPKRVPKVCVSCATDLAKNR